MGASGYARGIMERNEHAKILLTLGLAAVFGYFGTDKFIHPLLWIGWIPAWMDGMMSVPKETWLSVIGALEILTAALILIPVRNVQKIGVSLAILQLLGIVSHVGWNDVGVRDGMILISAIALLMML